MDNNIELNNNKKKKNIIIIITILMIILVIIGITYAYFQFNLDNDSISGTASCYTVNYTKGQDISGELVLGATYTSGKSTDIVMYSDPSCALMQGTLYVTTNPESTMDFSDKALKYTVVSNNQVLAEGSIDGTTNQIIYEDFILNTTQTTYNVYIWLDSSLEDTTTLDNETFSGFIHAEAVATSNIGVPLSYQRIEYIETTGTQYINTGFNPNPTTTKVETTFQVTNNSKSTQGLFGCRNQPAAVDNTSSNIFFNVSTNKLRLDWVGKSGVTHDVSLNSDYTMTCENNVVTINGSTYNSTTTKYNGYLNYPIYIGTFNAGGNPYTNGAYSRFKSFKIWDNGTLVRDYVPVLRKADNEVGLYDLVGRKFYTNAGTGKFVNSP